jgi:hypothetical protein
VEGDEPPEAGGYWGRVGIPLPSDNSSEADTGPTPSPPKPVESHAMEHDVGFTLCDQGAERLGLLGEEDKNLVNLDRTIEMFRQTREEEPEKVERISHLRDGIRAAQRAAGPADGEPSHGGGHRVTYVNCRAGAQGRLLLRERIWRGRRGRHAAIPGADLSAPEEPGMPLQASHNATVRAAGYAFDDEHLRKVRAQGAKQPELTHTQSYVLTELRRIHGELGPEDWGEKVERLEEVCRFEVSTVVRRELNAAHRAALRK